MAVLVYTFNNGVFIKDEDALKPLAYNEKDLDSKLLVKSRYASYHNYFIEISELESFDKNLLARKHTSTQINDYELVNKGKLKSTLTRSEYENLTDYYKSFYKKGSEQEVVTFEKEKSYDVMTLDKDFTEFNSKGLPEGFDTVRTFINPHVLMSDLIPNELKHLFPCGIDGVSLFKLLASKFESNPPFKKGRVNIYGTSLIVYLYEKEYNNEMVKQEVLKQNGRPYANRQYRWVKDLPKVVVKKNYDYTTFPTLLADNEYDLILKVEKVLNAVISDIAD